MSSPQAATAPAAAADPPVVPASKKRCDRRALPVARSVLAVSEADLVILFGSRARGDYDRRSDIDIMLLQTELPEDDDKAVIKEIARAAARASYGWEAPTQLVWRTRAEFRHQRRYVNSVETNAIRDGIVMPRRREDYHAADYEDGEVECAHDWTLYSERLRHAETHLDEFAFLAENGRNDLVIGQQAQSALEHGMKALLEAHGARYRSTHNLSELLGNIYYNDPELREFQLFIPPEFYTVYADGEEYERRVRPLLTSFSDYAARTLADAQRIIDRAKQVRAQK